MATVFAIDRHLADKYHGSGHALAAVRDGSLVDLVYLSDLYPDRVLVDEVAVEAAINDERTGPVIDRLQALGQVYVGMCSCNEFVVL